MGKINERCAGIDVGKRFLLCCVLTGSAYEEPRSQTRRFDATVTDLLRLREWLVAEDITHVVMESTGSYWIPVFNILEGHFVIVLANPEEVKNRKGHKTDRKDAEHLAELLRHNHVRASYIPPKPIRDLRDLTRRRLQLTQDATRERNRVEKLLEHVNPALGSSRFIERETMQKQWMGSNKPHLPERRRSLVAGSVCGIVSGCRAVLKSRNMFWRAVERHLNPGIRRAVCTQIPDRNRCTEKG